MTAETPTVEVSAKTVLRWLPTPITAHDADGSVVYANESFQNLSGANPVGSDIDTILNGYVPGDGGGFVVPAGTDSTFVAVVRTPSRVERGEPSPTTVLALREPSHHSEQSGIPTHHIGTDQSGAAVDPTRQSPTTGSVGAEVSAEGVLSSLATPVVVHDADGSVIYANNAFRNTSTDPVGMEAETVLNGYELGRAGTLVTPKESERQFLTAVQPVPSVENGSKSPVTIVALRMSTPSASDATGASDEWPDSSFERLIENSNDSVFVMSTGQDEFFYVNKRACEMLGYDQSELLSLTPRDIHPHDYPEFHTFMEEVVDTGSGWTTELSCYHSDGRIIPAEVSATVVEMDGRRRLVANVRDISTRVEQQSEIRRRSQALEAMTEGIALFNQEGMATYANPAFADAVGVADAVDVRGRTWGELFGKDDQFEMAVRPAAENGDGWTETIRVTTDGEERAYALSVTSAGDYIVCAARDVTDHQRRVKQLRELTAASRAFVDDEDTLSVAESAVSVIKETIGFQTVCFRGYNPETNRLERVAETSRAAELMTEEIAYDMDASRAGRALKTGERLSIAAGDDAYAADRGHLHVPVGETGVITVAAPGGFRESDAELIGLFAETVRTALTRVERLQQLRDRETALDRQRNELAAAVEFNELVSDVIRSVVSSSTQQETEQAVCNRLVESGEYDGAWILGTDRAVRASTVSTTADFPTSEGFVTSSLADRLLTGMSDGLSVERRRFESEEPETTTAAAVRIRCGAQDFGTLVVLSQGEHAFPDAAEGGIELLAETLGFALVASRSQEALMSSDVTEVVIEVPSPFSELTATYDCHSVYRETSTTSSGELLYVGVVKGVGADTVRSAFDDVSVIKSVISDGPNECTVHMLGEGHTLELISNTGANIRSVVAENGETRVTAEVPSGVDVSSLLDRLREQFGDVTLCARRDSRRLVPDRAISEDALTDRQREAVCTAYRMGYYDWPREHTAEEVAETLNVAGSTLHQHLRSAQRKLAEHLCENSPDAS